MNTKKTVVLLLSQLALLAGSTSQAASLFRAERWYERPIVANPGFDWLLDESEGVEFHVFQNTPSPGLAARIQYSPSPGDVVRLNFEIGEPFPAEPRRYEQVTNGPGSPPWMRYSISTAAVTNFDGWFEVLELDYAEDGRVKRLAIDFLVSRPSIHLRQYDRGRLRFNSSIPVPEPDTVCLGVAAIVSLLQFAPAARLTRRSS